MREGTPWWDSCPYMKRKREQSSLSPSLSCEDAVRRQLSANLGQGSHQDLDPPAPWSPTCSFQNREEIHLCCVSPPLCGTLYGSPSRLGQAVCRAGLPFKLFALSRGNWYLDNQMVKQKLGADNGISIPCQILWFCFLKVYVVLWRPTFHVLKKHHYSLLL